MTAVNHSLTGALIGLSVADPLVALPLALLSHYVLDSLPHFGYKWENKKGVSSSFIVYLIIEAILCFVVVAVLFFSKPFHWPLAIACAFLAAAPDLLSFNRFNKKRNRQAWKPSLYAKFAGGIQWFEKPIGLVVEAVWFASMIFCISIFLR